MSQRADACHRTRARSTLASRVVTHASGPKGKCLDSPIIRLDIRPAGAVPVSSQQQSTDSRHPDLDGHPTATAFADRKWPKK